MPATVLSGQLDLSSVNEGVALASNTDIARFTDNILTDTASAFSATIDWGDGTTTPGTVAGSNGSFTVDGGHTYGDDTITDFLTLDDAHPIFGADHGGAMPGIGLAGQLDLSAVNEGEALASNTTIATFTDNILTDTASAFSATIDWGDGTTTPGGI